MKRWKSKDVEHPKVPTLPAGVCIGTTAALSLCPTTLVCQHGVSTILQWKRFKKCKAVKKIKWEDIY